MSNRLYKFFASLLLLCFLTGQNFRVSSARASINTKVLTPNRAIASWPAGIPIAEKRPVVVFLPGWGGTGAVNAAISAQNTNFANQGYVTLAIGFDSSATWESDIANKTLQGLNKLCADSSIPANCNAIVLNGVSYGGAQNYWVIEYLLDNGYAGGVGSQGKVLGFVSEDAGYGAPGTLTNPTTGAFTRSGLADTSRYSVAMIENLGDTTFPTDECTWGNCGARVVSNAHFSRGDQNVFSMCPAGGGHGTRGYANWNNWVISATKRIIHEVSGIPAFTGYTLPALQTANSCANVAIVLPGLSVSGTNIVANGQPVRLRGVNMGDPFWARGWYGATYSANDYVLLAQDWKANVVRISVFPTQWKNMNRAAFLQGLGQEINSALNNGLYVIISYHVIGWPDGWYQPAYGSNPPDTYDSGMIYANAFWAQMAQTYGSDTRIIFDLWNEPAHLDDATLHGSDPNPLWPPLRTAYTSLIQTVRNNGGQNIVIATGNRWASWLVGIKDNPLADTNVVYAYHKYSFNGSNTPAQWNQDLGGLVGVKPIMVTEWGFEDSDVTSPTWPGSAASYGDPFTQWLENNRFSNLAWMYHHDWTPAFFKPNGSLTIYGAYAKNYISTYNSFSGKPDLVVTSAVVTPQSFGPNMSFDVVITIRNQGGATGSVTIYRDVYIDRDPMTTLNPITHCPAPGDYYRSDAFTNLAPGQTDTRTVTVTNGLSSGVHQLWVYVDSRCLVDEAGESNNSP